MNKFVTIIAVAIILMAFKNDKPAYRIFNDKSKPVKYDKLLEAAADADVVFFGEFHNNPICHWLQYELTKDIYIKHGDKLVLGAEMFEADNQLLLNEYLSSAISEKSFEKEARLWPNYTTDYKPLVEFAKDSSLLFIATNIPRRYASVVFKKGWEGLDSISAQAKSYIAPLPIEYDAELECYKKMAQGMPAMGGHPNVTMPMAQAIKDATMAYNIAGYCNDNIFIHYNGAYHSDNYQGIIWYLKKYKPGVKILTITTVEQNSVEKLEDDNSNKADFTIVVTENMTKTY